MGEVRGLESAAEDRDGVVLGGNIEEGFGSAVREEGVRFKVLEMDRCMGWYG